MAEDASDSDYIPFKRKRLDSSDGKKSDDEKHIILNITDSITDAKDQTDEPKVGGSGCKHAENGKVKDDSQPQNVEEEDDDNLSTISNLSDLMEESWRPTAGPMMWIQTQMMMGTKPREILSDLIPDTAGIPDDIDDLTLWKIIINIMSEPERRNKLKNFNTLDDAIHLLQTRENIIVLTGAGVSVSCGIPDFRSRDGIYARLAVEFPDLPDPQAMFDIKYFKNDPRPFFKFAKEIYPGQFEPSNSHKFIKLLEDHKKLLRNYTQNIDTLEQVAGIQNVIQCHGSFAEATCMQCRRKVKADDIREDIFNQIIPHCTECPKDDLSAVMKPDIVFFGESLSDEFHKQMAEDKKKCDLLIVIGSSLKVRPVALIPHSLPSEVPQILINREPHKHNNFDIELLGDCDTIISEICKRLGTGWESLTDKSPTKTEIHQSQFNKKRSKEKKKNLENLPSKGYDHQHLHEIEKSKLQNTNESENAANSNETKINESKTHQNTEVKLPNEIESVTVEQESTEKKNSSETGLNSENKSEELHNHKTTFESANQETKETGQNESEKTHDPTSQNETKSGEFPDEKQTAGGSNEDLEQMRKMWQPKNKESLAKQLEDNQYLFIPPSQYVFHGAEIYSEDEISDDDFRFSSNSSSSSCSMKSDEDKEEEGEIYTSDEEDIDECESTEHLRKSYSESNEPICLSERDSLSSSSRCEDNIPSEENS